MGAWISVFASILNIYLRDFNFLSKPTIIQIVVVVDVYQKRINEENKKQETNKKKTKKKELK